MGARNSRDHTGGCPKIPRSYRWVPETPAPSSRIWFITTIRTLVLLFGNYRMCNISNRPCIRVDLEILPLFHGLSYGSSDYRFLIAHYFSNFSGIIRSNFTIQIHTIQSSATRYHLPSMYIICWLTEWHHPSVWHARWQSWRMV